MQAGDSFDLAVALTSLLIGVGYNAYVVVGYAPDAVVFNDQSQTVCPLIVSSWPESTINTLCSLTTTHSSLTQQLHSPLQEKERREAEGGAPAVVTGPGARAGTAPSNGESQRAGSAKPKPVEAKGVSAFCMRSRRIPFGGFTTRCPLMHALTPPAFLISFLPLHQQKSKYQVKQGTQLFSKFLKGQEEKAQKEEEEARKAGGDASPDDQQVRGRRSLVVEG